MKSDAEVLAHLQRHDGKICGRFSIGQLDRPLVAKNKIKRGGLTTVAASFAAVLAAQQPNTPANAEPAPVVQVPIGDADVVGILVFNEPDIPQDSLRTISGRVLDESGASLPFAMIHFANTIYNTTSDSNGDYYLKVPIDTLKSHPLEIVIKSSGYMMQIVTNLPKKFLEEDLALIPIQLSLEIPIIDFGTVGALVIDRRPKVRKFFDKIFR